MREMMDLQLARHRREELLREAETHGGPKRYGRLVGGGLVGDQPWRGRRRGTPGASSRSSGLEERRLGTGGVPTSSKERERARSLHVGEIRVQGRFAKRPYRPSSSGPRLPGSE
jgi:hypothetical protein